MSNYEELLSLADLAYSKGNFTEFRESLEKATKIRSSFFNYMNVEKLYEVHELENFLRNIIKEKSVDLLEIRAAIRCLDNPLQIEIEKIYDFIETQEIKNILSQHHLTLEKLSNKLRNFTNFNAHGSGFLLVIERIWMLSKSTVSGDTKLAIELLDSLIESFNLHEIHIPDKENLWTSVCLDMNLIDWANSVGRSDKAIFLLTCYYSKKDDNLIGGIKNSSKFAQEEIITRFHNLYFDNPEKNKNFIQFSARIFQEMAASQISLKLLDLIEDSIILKCPSCNSEISSNAKFCSECGYQIKTT